MLSSFFSVAPKDEASVSKQQKLALDELRQKIGSTKVEEQLRQGGEPGVGAGPGLNDSTLLRWLRAEKYDVDKAYNRLVKHAQWRADYVPDGRIHEGGAHHLGGVTLHLPHLNWALRANALMTWGATHPAYYREEIRTERASEVKNELASKKSYVLGHNKQGQTMGFVVVRNHSRSTRDLHETKRFICYSLDALTNGGRSEDGKVGTILDLRDLTMDNIDASTLKAIFDMLQEHYPERLGTMYMYKAPTIFMALWAVVKPFLDPVTQEKVQFLKDAAAWSKFTDALDLEMLPPDLGGKGEPECISKFNERMGLIPAGETLSTRPKHVPVDDDGEIVDINDQLQLDEKLQIGDSDDQKKKLQHAPDGPLTKALPT